MIIPCLLLFTIFSILSGFHFYWLFGGTWGLKQVIPTKENEDNMLGIPKFGTLIVALVLLLFGSVYFVKTNLIALDVPTWISSYIYWIIPTLFLLRTIGDFNYVGLFKKVKNTAFAKADTNLFVPLCIFISFIGFLIIL